MDSEEIARHFKEQTHTDKKGGFDAEKRRERAETLRNIERCVENEDFEEFSSLLDSLNVKDVERRRVAVAQFYQMVSDKKKKKSAQRER
jgi:pantothenate kinase